MRPGSSAKVIIMTTYEVYVAILCQTLDYFINAIYRCNNIDFFVKLIVGEPSQTFLVPATHIKFGWRPFGFLETVKNSMTNTTSKKLEPPSPSSSRRQSITESLRSGKKWFFSRSESKDLDADSNNSNHGPPPREIKLPDDDPVAWSAFLFWSMHPAGEIPDADRSRDAYCVRMWNLGSKYGFEDFADDVMMLLIKHFDQFETNGTVKQSVTFDAIRETYCCASSEQSVLKTLIAQEIAKSKLFDKCNFEHRVTLDPLNCDNCKEDKADMKERLKCTLPSEKKHSEDVCGLHKDLWVEVVKAKQMYHDTDKSLFNRLAKSRGKAPMYMTFLESSKWVHMRAMLNNEV